MMKTRNKVLETFLWEAVHCEDIIQSSPSSLPTPKISIALKFDSPPDSVDVAVNIGFQVWHPPTPVDQEQTNTEQINRIILTIVR